MTTATDAQLFGSTNVNYAVVNGKNMLYAGNVSGNGGSLPGYKWAWPDQRQ